MNYPRIEVRLSLRLQSPLDLTPLIHRTNNIYKIFNNRISLLGQS